MPFDPRTPAIAVALAALALAGCETDQSGKASFGEATRQTLAAQIIDPEPQYDGDAEVSAVSATGAVERYRTDKVKQPDRVRINSASGGGSSSSGGSN